MVLGFVGFGCFSYRTCMGCRIDEWQGIAVRIVYVRQWCGQYGVLEKLVFMCRVYTRV